MVPGGGKTMKLLDRLNQINAETEAWLAAGPDRWAGLLHTDLDTWPSCGITTAAELDEYLDACCEKDRYEDQYDYEPDEAHIEWCNQMELEELRVRDMYSDAAP